MKPYVLGIYEKGLPREFTWRGKLEAAKDAGYDFLEISIDETDEKLARLDWTAAERSELIAAMRETGLPIRSMCLSGHRKYPLGASDPAVRARSLEIMEKALTFADDLGIRIIQLAGYDVYYEPSTPDTARWFGENLAKCAALAERFGVLMGFETMETDFMNTVGKAMRWVDETGSPYLKVYPDLGNLTNAADGKAANVAADLKTGVGSLIAMHLKETVPGKFREIPFGTGHVDFERGVAEAWRLGVRRFVTEFWDVRDGNWESEMNTAVSMMRGILDKQEG